MVCPDLEESLSKIEDWRLQHNLVSFPKSNVEAWKHDFIHFSLRVYLGKSSQQLALLEGCRCGCPSLVEEALVSVVQKFLLSGSERWESRNFGTSISMVYFSLLCRLKLETGDWFFRDLRRFNNRLSNTLK
jgi:hypothetical protein